MRKYRIRIETRGDGRKVYFPEIKGRLWGWNPLKKYCYWGDEAIMCYDEESARNAINNHIDQYMRERVTKIEARYL